MVAKFEDDKLTDEFAIWTTDLDTWFRKSLVVDYGHSRVYAVMPNGELMAVTSVRIDAMGDLEFTITRMPTEGKPLAVADDPNPKHRAKQDLCEQPTRRGMSGPGYVTCDTPLDNLGQCVNASSHIEL